MPLERARGIVLRRRPLTETSLIVHWLTAEQGRLATVAKGALRPKSPLRGKLDLFYRAEFTFQRSRRSTLHTLREVVVQDTHAALREHYERLRQAAYAARLVELMTEEDTPLPGPWELLASWLDLLARRVATPAEVFAFELRLLADAGLQPDWREARLSESARDALRVLATLDFRAAEPPRLDGAQTTEIRQFLHGFLIYHLGRLPAGRAAALRETD
jgi:DNA repair protein RecO (recombination protein O)